MEAVVEGSEGAAGAASAAMQGVVEAALVHPALDDLEDEEKNARLQSVASCAANAAVKAAEENEQLDPVEVAAAVAKGGARGLGDDIDPGQLTALVDGMSDGGVGGADEPNKPAVARAIMRAVASVVPPELRDLIGVEPGEEDGDDEDEDGGLDGEPTLPPPPANPIEPEDVSDF